MAGKHRTAEQKIAWIASRAWGIATRAELRAAEITRHQIDERLRSGALIAVFRGVYRVGHTAHSTEATYMAAVKACGDGAVLSGLAAAHLYGLVKGKAPPPEVTAPRHKRIRGIETHRARDGLYPHEKSRWRGIPVTSVPRTLVDISSVLAVDALTRACHEAGVRFGTTPRQVDAVLQRRPNARGAKKLRRVLHGDEHVALSKLEKRFLELLREHGVPLPETNRPAGAHRVDCRWPEHKLTVELDGYRYHRSRYAWEQDHARYWEARERGEELTRYTWDDVYKDPARTVADVVAQLGAAKTRQNALP